VIYLTVRLKARLSYVLVTLQSGMSRVAKKPIEAGTIPPTRNASLIKENEIMAIRTPLPKAISIAMVLLLRDEYVANTAPIIRGNPLINPQKAAPNTPVSIGVELANSAAKRYSLLVR